MPRHQLPASTLHKLNYYGLIHDAEFKEIQNLSNDDICKNPSRELATVFQKNGQVVVLFYPVKDTDDNNSKAKGLTPLATALSLFLDDGIAKPDCPMRLQIPLAETIGRNHYVYLDIAINGNNVEANLYDSKGNLSSIYPTDRIRRLLVQQFPNKMVRFYEHYLANQSLLNTVDCGRFVMIYLHYISCNLDKNANELKAHFKDLFHSPHQTEAVLNKFQERYNKILKKEDNAGVVGDKVVKSLFDFSEVGSVEKIFKEFKEIEIGSEEESDEDSHINFRNTL